MDDIIFSVSKMLDCSITACEPIASGRNSRIYKMTDPARNAFAVKHYHHSPARKSLETEFAALSFLNESGIEQVPRAIAARPDLELAVYSYVEGEPCGIEPADRDISTFVDFLLRLDGLHDRAEGWTRPAVDACIVPGQVLEDIRRRSERLLMTGNLTPLHRDMHAFVGVRLARILETIRAWAETAFPLSEPLLDVARVLSPSDFGLHNTIRTPNGTMVFVDFEFFGWDDPAKLAADFLLHPAMRLSEGDKRQFAGRLRDELREGDSLAKRLPVTYSLHAVKWCLILLNEFVPEHLARRRFAGDTRRDDFLLAEQLVKAQRLADHVQNNYRDFPYFG